MKSILFIISSLSGGNGKILVDVAIDQSIHSEVSIEIITNIYDEILIDKLQKYKIKYNLGTNKSTTKIKNILKILKNFRSKKKELIISFDAVSNFYSFILRIIFGTRWFAGVHGLEGAFTRKWSLINKIILNKSQKCIVPSFAVQNKLEKSNIIAKKNVTVIHNGINIPNTFQKRNLNNNFKICLIGNFYSLTVKGHQIAIDTFKILPKKFTLTIFGHGKYYQYYKNYIKKLNLNNRVIMPGYCNKDMMKKELEKCMCVIAPSSTEAFGVSILESMSLSVPVIANKTGGITEIIQDGVNGILINNISADLLAEKIISLSIDKTSNYSMSSEGYAHVKKNFNKKKMLDEYDKIISMTK